ncbi:hypothetical protein OH77DRAFT_1416300 [Trametes cingulata]|nr:hypothetical protein OH77DRAFT_1416300 [Trametes cingulata]
MAHSTFVDASNTVLVQYFEPPSLSSSAGGSAWFTNQSGTLLGSVYNSTLTGCSVSGASVVFTFNGSNVYAFGSVVDSGGGDPPESVYSVDGDSPTSFTAPQVTGRRDAVQFFGSGALPLRNHTLIINITKASPSAPYYLDYLQFSTDVLPLDSPSSSLTATTSVSQSTSQSAGSPTTSAPAGSSDVARKPTAPTGAIVGGVVGGLAFLCILIALLYWRRNKRPEGEYNYGTKAHQDRPPNITPFPTSASTPSLLGLAPTPLPMSQSPGGEAGVSGRSTGQDHASQAPSSDVTTSSSSVANATAPSQSEAPPAARASRRLTELSYMRPPSTTAEGYPFHGMETLSDPGGGETLPAYTPS